MSNDQATVTIRAYGPELSIELELHIDRDTALRICRAAMNEAEDTPPETPPIIEHDHF